MNVIGFWDGFVVCVSRVHRSRVSYFSKPVFQINQTDWTFLRKSVAFLMK